MSFQESDIARLTAAFYAKVRVDDLIGPIFTARSSETEWEKHISHIADFWSSVLLKTDRFSGNPMSKHLQISEIEPRHFKRWLLLFQQTAQETLEPDQAIEVLNTANRIAQSLQMGLAFNYRKHGLEDHPFVDFEPKGLLRG